MAECTDLVGSELNDLMIDVCSGTTTVVGSKGQKAISRVGQILGKLMTKALSPYAFPTCVLQYPGSNA